MAIYKCLVLYIYYVQYIYVQPYVFLYYHKSCHVSAFDTRAKIEWEVLQWYLHL